MLHDFRLDRFEVTVGRFRPFIRDGFGLPARAPSEGDGAHAWTPNSGWRSEWNASLPQNSTEQLAGLRCDPVSGTWTDVAAGMEDLPVTCVSWFEAMAFCVWSGGHLPSALEFEYASQGGDEQRMWPWSVPAAADGLSCSKTRYKDPLASCDTIVAPGTTPGGEARWGHDDLTGNVEEWVLDHYTGFAFPEYIDPCSDCAQVEAVPGWEDRAVRGGGIGEDERFLRPADWRTGLLPSMALGDLGFRCAYDIE